MMPKAIVDKIAAVDEAERLYLEHRDKDPAKALEYMDQWRQRAAELLELEVGAEQLRSSGPHPDKD